MPNASLQRLGLGCEQCRIFIEFGQRIWPHAWKSPRDIFYANNYPATAKHLGEFLFQHRYDEESNSCVLQVRPIEQFEGYTFVLLREDYDA